MRNIILFASDRGEEMSERIKRNGKDDYLFVGYEYLGGIFKSAVKIYLGQTLIISTSSRYENFYSANIFKKDLDYLMPSEFGEFLDKINEDHPDIGTWILFHADEFLRRSK